VCGSINSDLLSHLKEHPWWSLREPPVACTSRTCCHSPKLWLLKGAGPARLARQDKKRESLISILESTGGDFNDEEEEADKSDEEKDGEEEGQETGEDDGGEDEEEEDGEGGATKKKKKGKGAKKGKKKEAPKVIEMVAVPLMARVTVTENDRVVRLSEPLRKHLNRADVIRLEFSAGPDYRISGHPDDAFEDLLFTLEKPFKRWIPG
jgi:chromatin remodeling complex protein RSC6